MAKSQFLREGLHEIETMGVHAHLLVDKAGRATLIDCGFATIKPLAHTLGRLGLGWKSIHAILLTHGHLDHVGNLRRLKAATGAPAYAYRNEQLHIDGRYPYRRWNRVCGALERTGRILFRYKPAEIDVYLENGDVLPLWGGLKVVHLPGHTTGHCGFYSRNEDVLFSGDLATARGPFVYTPPACLNTAPDFFPISFKRILALDPSLVVPNHYWRTDLYQFSSRLKALCKKRLQKEGHTIPASQKKKRIFKK